MQMTLDQLEDSLARIIKRLLYNEVFFGMFTMQLKHKWMSDAEMKGTEAATAWDGEDFWLYLNKDTWPTCSDFARKCLIKHEILHLSFYHVIDGHKWMKKNHKIANLAADMVVDQYINDINLITDRPYTTIESVAAQLQVSPSEFPVDKGMGEYYKIIERILKERQKNNKNGQGGGGGMGMGQGSGQGDGDGDGQGNDDGLSDNSNHNHWNDGSNDSNSAQQQVQQELMRQSINQKLLQAEAATTSDGRGTIPGALQGILDKLHQQEEPVFNWGAYVRQFVQTALKSHRESSKHKLNMRYEGWEDMFPGFKRSRDHSICVAIDTSGSVSNKLLQKFEGQMRHIAKTTEITVVECDTQIGSIFKYDKKKDFKITGRGGTEFQPVIDYYIKNKRKFGCLIYFTDGECPPPKVEAYKGSILWVTYGPYINKDLATVGRMIHIDEKDY